MRGRFGAISEKLLGARSQGGGGGGQTPKISAPKAPKFVERLCFLGHFLDIFGQKTSILTQIWSIIIILDTFCAKNNDFQALSTNFKNFRKLKFSK